MTDDASDLAALRALPISPRPVGYVATRDGDALARVVVAQAAGWPDLEAVIGDVEKALADDPSLAVRIWADAVLGELADRRRSGTATAPDQTG